MFFDGVGGYTPPPTPNEYNLSLGCDTEAVIPATSIVVGIITLCDTSYLIEDVFATQADLINFLNTVFTSAFGLLGIFSIDSNDLIYTTTDECAGVNCIEIENNYRITEDDQIRITEDGNIRIIE